MPPIRELSRASSLGPLSTIVLQSRPDSQKRSYAMSIGFFSPSEGHASPHPPLTLLKYEYKAYHAKASGIEATLFQLGALRACSATLAYPI